MTEIFAKVHQVQGFGFARFWQACFTELLQEDKQDPICFREVMTFWHQKFRWSKEPLDTSLHRNTNGCNCRSGGGKPQCFNAVLLWVHSYDMTLRTRAGLLVGSCIPGKLSVLRRRVDNRDSHTCTRWGCYRPDSCYIWLSNVSVIIWRCFPEQPREKQT